ncbi:MAG TPA: SDR family NAD(P)-dependent oxidoreductase [Jatrophihabitans sp.]|nr:SDR family NAD(P)-dependent oxidoreductase [Jatrophihabitans sp.]
MNSDAEAAGGRGPGQVAGKVIVITGAGSGIGRALAVNLARRGALLALSDQDEAGLADTVAMLGSAKLRSDRLDVRDRTAMAAYAAAVAEEFGTVNVVINNAGVALTGSVLDMTYQDMEWILDIDFWGVVNGTKEFLPYLIRSGDGHIVNLSSLFGLLGIPGQSAYNAAKFAVRGFTESLRQEMVAARLPVRVTSVHPGGIKTAIARNARVAAGEDQAALAEYFDRKLAKMEPERAAEIIVRGMLAGKGRVIVGADAKALHLFQLVLGWRYQNVVAAVTRNRVPQRKVGLR